MNDIAQASKLFHFIIYTDDTTLSNIEIVVRTTVTTIVPICDILNNELSMLNNWLTVNKLSLNIRKSKYFIFRTKEKKIQSLTLTINNVNIKRIAEFNFLGLCLDEHLTWKCHINKISN